ncbi:putative ras-specific guanine nucleotide-releasing factor [Phytophthora cinnamomi]|uniref:putative ras-specific guanine nucleotide-releasing factor n=1 Tax=Phytophthora cinnamomi TaxID=4785 RepID=UPI003559FEAC|nr:putative ras-specific guanine nucleotide-releasing factor [Phytophthora cinnamomi]
MDRSALDLHRAAAASLTRDPMERSATDSGRQLSFSTFLMDEVGTPPVRVTRRAPPPLPPLRASHAASSAPAPRRRGESDGDIPVLEAARDSSGFRLDGADQAEVDVPSDDEDAAAAAAAGRARVVVGEYDAEEDDFVPVLQTAEDARAAHRHMGGKKFSWRVSARRGVPTGRAVRVPDQETLLRMSARSTELASSYSSSNSQGSRRNSASVRIDRELVRSGWLYKQANVMKTWKRRYFVLIKRTNIATGEYWASLQYYKGSNFGKLRGEMHLQDGMLSVRFLEPDETKRPFCFEVAGEDFSFVCSGSNDDDASAWVCLLQSLSGGGSSTMPPSAALLGTSAAGSLLQSSEGSKGIRTTTIDARSIRIVAELRRVLHTSKSPEAAKFKSFTNSFECRSSGSLRKFREFHATLTESIIKDHGARILAAFKDPGNADANGTIDKKSSALPMSLDILRSAVSRHVEEVLFLPLEDNINSYLRRVYHEDESSINRKVRWLQGKDQMYFNIPLHQISWKEWRKASRILAQIANVHLPAAKYDVLTSTIKEIQSTYAEEHDTIAELEPLETDDIIPIFTYVLSNSGLENLISLKTLLTELNGSWAVGKSTDDETSLNILTHAVDFISNVSIPAVLEDIFKDQITLSIDDHGMAMEKIAAMSPSVPSPMGEDNHHHHKHHHQTTVDLRSSIHVDNSSVISTMNYLVQSGADMSAVCELYRTPLHYAALYGCDELFACLLAKMGDNSSAEMRDIYGQSAVSMAEANRSSHALADENASSDDCATIIDDYSEMGDDNDDSDDEDEDVDELEPDIPMSLTGRKDMSGKTLSIKDLVTEENDGVEEIIAGTFDAIADLLLQFENYRLEELNALIWYCGYASNGGADNYKEMVDILQILWKRYSIGTEAGFYARRMVLSALNKLVEILKHSVECDMDVCNYVAEFFSEVVPLQDDLGKEDPQCAQWLNSSLLPEFVDACQSSRMQDFQVLSFCESDYKSLKQFICTAKQAHPNLAFLDDDLFAAATGMEIITEAMRRRMSLAGVWMNGEAKQSFVVKPEENIEPPPEGRSTTITPWQPRGVNVGRNYPGEQRVTRLWILDLDPSIIAQQITLMQHYLFSKIKVSEVLASKRNAEKTPGYQRLRLLHNHISIWVVSQILMRGDVDQRAEILAYFIRVAGVLLSPLQNLDGFMAVMNAANDSSIFRLKKTWGRLPPQARDLWQELVPLTEKGARPLNKFTKEATPPLIPYMGVVIQNVIALQEFPDRVEGDLINFKKIRSIGFLIHRILSFQKTPYLLPTDKRVLEYLCSPVPYIDSESCFARSLKIEPRVADAASEAS